MGRGAVWELCSAKAYTHDTNDTKANLAQPQSEEAACQWYAELKCESEGRSGRTANLSSLASQTVNISLHALPLCLARR